MTAIPSFALYGEDHWQSPPGFAHVETIAERSALHGWAIAPHRHDRAVQVLVVASGQAKVRLDGAMVTLAGPAFIVVPTGAVHAFRFSPATEGHVLTLSQEFAGRTRGDDDPLAAFLAGGGHGAIPPEAARRVAWLAAELARLEHDPAAPDLLFESLAEALCRSLVTGGGSMGGGDRRLALFRHLVETHLTEHRPLAFYASSIGLTVRTLTRLCQARLGHAPKDLIHRRLALEAQRMLRFSDASVTRIAAELGFADTAYFSRFYLRMTGLRPQAERSANPVKAAR
jgi:AraC family transcriptional activator of pobA